MAIALIVVYGICMLFIFLYSLVQIQLVFHYLRKRKLSEKIPNSETIQEDDLPIVTIQLPVYNEKYVVGRLIDCVAEMDYPMNKLEIQVLDDSNDETLEIVASKVQQHRSDGLDIKQVRREQRTGFKAGALAHGLKLAKGELLAIFDADFLPSRDFLRRTIPHFRDDKVGMVQTKWEHINKNYSLLTRLQAFGLDAHFSVEQSGRNKGGHFINFNGTAGIWRKQCIEDSGGWHADTLTEDLDLSYRAQMRGWRFQYMEDCGSPAELPAEMNALKTQQYRWTKGAAECSRKNLGSLLRSGKFSLNTKINGIFHLLNSTLFICIILTSLLSMPMLFVKHNYPQYALLFRFAGVFLLGILFLAIFYYTSFASKGNFGVRSLAVFIFEFPLFLAVSMGLSLHNGIAAVEGLIGRKSPFVRTPKFNITEAGGAWKGNHYLGKRIGKLTYVEALLTLYFCSGLLLSIHYGDYGLLPFLVMLVIGYTYVTYQSVKHALT